jgi:hypothetical protein
VPCERPAFDVAATDGRDLDRLRAEEPALRIVVYRRVLCRHLNSFGAPVCRCVGVVTGPATAAKGVWVATRMEGDKIIKRTQEGVKK